MSRAAVDNRAPCVDAPGLASRGDDASGGYPRQRTLSSLISPARALDLRQESPGSGRQPARPRDADHADALGDGVLDGVVVDQRAGAAAGLHDVVEGLVDDVADLGVVGLPGVPEAL